MADIISWMKTILLDANELSRDYLCTGLKFELLERTLNANWFTAYVSASVFEETVANYERAVEEAGLAVGRLARRRKMLGLEPLGHSQTDVNYRRYLAEMFDERLGISVLAWPEASHRELVGRAVARTPPFDEKGGGYRDSLIWMDVLRLATSGHDVALVTSDKAFASNEGDLHPMLAAEIEPLTGSVELVRDFGSWLLNALPWSAKDLPSAVGRSRDEEFYTYYLQSDLQDNIFPTVEEFGFSHAPVRISIGEVQWGGRFESVEASTGPDGVSLVQYELDQTVEFDGTFPEAVYVEQGWVVSEPDALGRVQIAGAVQMVVRIVVLFGGQFGFTVDELSWSRVGETHGKQPSGDAIR